MATFTQWFEGARLRTLPAAASPVMLGTGVAYGTDPTAASWPRALLALGVALFLQIAVNYANDYSDGIRGTDDKRNGPTRLTASGAASSKQVLLMVGANFVIAAALGIWLIFLCGSWWLLGLGAAAIIAAWFYTGGTHPYGYMGLGELFVFLFFGLMATVGTTWTQILSVPWQAWTAAVGVGLLSCALLMINNIRDIPTDKPAHKLTLAVRLGDRLSRIVYTTYLGTALILGAVISPNWLGWGVTAALTGATAFVVLPVFRGASGRSLIPVLRNTGILTLLYGVGLGISLAIN